MTEAKRYIGLTHPEIPSPYPELNDEAIRLFVRLRSRMGGWPGFTDSRIRVHLELALLPLAAVPYRIARDYHPTGAKINLDGKHLTALYRNGIYIPTFELEVARFTAEAITIRACRNRTDSCFTHTTVMHDTLSGVTNRTIRNSALAIALVEDFIDQI